MVSHGRCLDVCGGQVWGCRGVDDDVSSCHKLKAIEFRIYPVGEDLPLALSGGLAGHHPSINCMDGMVRCNVGLAKLNYVDLVPPPSKCPYLLDSRRLGPAHISDVTGGKGLNHYGTALCVPYLDPGSLVGLQDQDMCVGCEAGCKPVFLGNSLIQLNLFRRVGRGRDIRVERVWSVWVLVYG